MAIMAVVVVVGVWVGGALSQQGGGGGQGQWGGRGGDPAQRRQRLMDGIKDRIGASDAEWEALQPKVSKVYDLAQESGIGVNTRALGRRRPQQPTAGDAEDLSAASRTKQTLEQALSEGSGDEDVTAKLAAYRKARDATRKELAAARAALKAGVSVTQEAQLVLLGLLD